MTARIFTAAEAKDFLNDPSPSSEYDMVGVAEDLARSVVHWSERAADLEAEVNFLEALVADLRDRGGYP